ncbi:hypothetical protein TRIP_D440221 [uncultured Paludibacter sp.]|uniref:Helix-turn-helix domain-containing protein n=1 Tax=uncultured Paludibacter sp. TaxID=497635 RepID=A0A653AJF6_9BACT|nr:hypothetical protein TRIP_D440221 [uncultured Paludibacter sp.]
MKTNIIIDISNKRWMSETEAVTYTTLSRDSLRFFRDTNQLPFRMFGKNVKYERKDLDIVMEGLEYHENGKIRKSKLAIPKNH